jgi:3-oxoacyl-[acyl-carrier-protein] synthase I
MESWAGRLAISGIGLVTPVGLSAPASLTALRAGISRIAALPSFQVANAKGEPAPMLGAEVPKVPANRQGPERLARMAEAAMREAVAQARVPRALRDQRYGLFLGTPAANPAGRILAYGPGLAEHLRQVLADLGGSGAVCLCETGRAAALHALRVAARELTREDRPLDLAIVGGVDSLIAARTLTFLQANGRLREGRKSSGILPGEGAAFLVLEKSENAARRGVAVLATLETCAGELDPTPFGKPNKAVALTKVFRGVAPTVAEPRPLLISDLNGERPRAFEWMFASSRASFYHGGMPHWLSSESIGDCGAASGAVNCCWAVGALGRGYAPAREAVVWGASDEGAREAVVIKSATGVN